MRVQLPGIGAQAAQRSRPGRRARRRRAGGRARPWPGPDYGRRLARLESWGAGGADDSWRAASPWRQLNLPQIRLEPLLKARAEELSPGRSRFGHELTGLEQDGDGVRATVRDNASGREYVVRCRYLLGADGGRRVASLIGVDYEGLGVITQTATLHVSADFSPWAPDPDVLIRWIFSPQAGVLVVMVPMGPQRWGPASEEWVIHLNYPVDDPRAQSDAQVEADARQALGIPDLPMKIHKITRWSVEAVMASAFQAGRVFLVGDAAHRHPPTGGLGLTSAIHDAQNLCWKLALVLAGHASPALLDTYQAERRSVDQRNAQRSLENAVNHFQIGAALGLSHENTPEQNMAELRRMWSGRPEDAGHRSGVLRAMRAQSMEFSELNVEYGYCYESAAVVPDGSTAPTPADEIRVYEPSTRPGAPLPHAWIDDEDGNRRPVKDLLAPGRFLLIAGEDGQAWCEAARQLAAEAGVPLDAVRIGHLDGDYHDPRCAWQRHRADRQRRRGPGPPGPVHRLAAPGRRQRPPGRPRRRAQPDPRPAGGVLAAFAGVSRLRCLLTTVSWLRSLNERTCLALDHEAAAQQAAVCERSHAVTRAARGAARRPLQIEVHRLVCQKER